MERNNFNKNSKKAFGPEAISELANQRLIDEEERLQEENRGVLDAGDKKKRKPLSLNFLYKLIKSNDTPAQ